MKSSPPLHLNLTSVTPLSMVSKVKQLLEALAPIQPELQALYRAGSAADVLPWATYGKVWTNAAICRLIAEAIHDADETGEVKRIARITRRWVAYALVERALRPNRQWMAAPMTLCMIHRYMRATVRTRTLCAAHCPDLMELVTKVL